MVGDAFGAVVDGGAGEAGGHVGGAVLALVGVEEELVGALGAGVVGALLAVGGERLAGAAGVVGKYMPVDLALAALLLGAAGAVREEYLAVHAD